MVSQLCQQYFLCYPSPSQSSYHKAVTVFWSLSNTNTLVFSVSQTMYGRYTGSITDLPNSLSSFSIEPLNWVLEISMKQEKQHSRTQKSLSCLYLLKQVTELCELGDFTHTDFVSRHPVGNYYTLLDSLSGVSGQAAPKTWATTPEDTKSWMSLLSFLVIA